MSATIFLNKTELKELTGISRGSNGKSANQLQCEHLRRQGIPFFENARGEPKVPVSYITGTSLTKKQLVEPKKWKPRLQ